MATALLAGLAVLSAVLLVLAFALLVSLGREQLNTMPAIANDGPRTGARAPALTLRSTAGAVVTVPADQPQVLLFADHSLIDFDQLVPGLVDPPPDVPGLVVIGADDRTSSELLAGLGLGVACAVAPARTYTRYRVRVMPYAVVVDAAGRVAGSGLVNSTYQLRQLVHRTLSPVGQP